MSSSLHVPAWDVPALASQPFALLAPVTGLAGVNLSNLDDGLYHMLAAHFLLGFLVTLYTTVLSKFFKFNSTVFPKIPGIGPTLADLSAHFPKLVGMAHTTANAAYLLGAGLLYAYTVFLMSKGVFTELKGLPGSLFNAGHHGASKSYAEASETFAWLCVFTFFMDSFFDQLLNSNAGAANMSTMTRIFSLMGFRASHACGAEYMFAYVLMFGSFRACDFLVRFNGAVAASKRAGDNPVVGAFPALPKVSDFRDEMVTIRDKALTGLLGFMVLYAAGCPHVWATADKKNAWFMCSMVLFLRTAVKCPWMAKEFFGQGGTPPSPMKKGR